MHRVTARASTSGTNSETYVVRRSERGSGSIRRIVAVTRRNINNDTKKDYEDVADERIIGECTCWMRKTDGGLTTSVFVSSLRVDEEFRRRGVGSALMREAERLGQSEFGAETASLSVNKWNRGAMAMYARLGFEMEGGRRRRRDGLVETLMDPLRLVQFRMEKRLF